MAFNKRSLSVLVLCVLVTSSLPLTTMQAQGDVILKLAIPDYMINFFNKDLLQTFTDQTGVKVVISPTDSPYFPDSAYNLDDHFEAVEAYVSGGDVLLIYSNQLAAETTRAGYFLDLSPLAGSDPTLYPEDFYPAAWESVQWDQGVWALPFGMDIFSLSYNPEAFDAAGLSYPTANWTIDDFDAAARALTQYNADGEVVIPGMLIMGSNLFLFRALLGENWYDEMAFPTQPDFSNPELAHILEVWSAMLDDSVNTFPATATSLNAQTVPLRIEQSFYSLSEELSGDAPSVGAYLPGGVVGIQVPAFAVSSGTVYPQEAYELAKFLSNSAGIGRDSAPAYYARQSLHQGAGIPQYLEMMTYSPENEAFLQDAVMHGQPNSDILFGGYIAAAISKMKEDEIDASTALEEVQEMALENLQVATARRDSTAIVVATPVPTPALAPGEVSLTFGIDSYSLSQNPDTWDEAIAEFIATDPEVKNIVLDTTIDMSGSMFPEGQDCFILSYNPFQSGSLLVDIPLLNIDPFLAADQSFDPQDLLSGVLDQLSQDNKVWGMPLSMRPQLLSYRIDTLERAGVPLPKSGWTTDAFLDALYRLKSSPDDPAPFAASLFSSTYTMQMLIAAFGGLPIDYRTDPPTIDFTSPEVVDAIRQVLDLARDGYIEYSALNLVDSAFSGTVVSVRSDDSPPITPGMFGTFMFSDYDNSYGFVPYPSGAVFSPVAYGLQSGFISDQTANPEACYRWLSYLSRRGELFGDLPVRSNIQADSPAGMALGEDALDFYYVYRDILASPNAVMIQLSRTSDQFEQHWLHTAFDQYVLEDVSLEEALAEAEQMVMLFRECEADVLSGGTLLANDEETYMGFLGCALEVDPRLTELFGDLD